MPPKLKNHEEYQLQKSQYIFDMPLHIRVFFTVWMAPDLIYVSCNISCDSCFRYDMKHNWFFPCHWIYRLTIFCLYLVFLSFKKTIGYNVIAASWEWHRRGSAEEKRLFCEVWWLEFHQWCVESIKEDTVICASEVICLTTLTLY